MTDDILEGGCLCGAVRYRATKPILGAVYCHCRMCQRSTAAPVSAWAAISPDQFAYTHGAPQIYRSSASAERQFCRSCGAQLVCRHDGEPYIAFTVATLDEPDQVSPALHIWTKSRIAWFDTHDTLPRLEGKAAG